MHALVETAVALGLGGVGVVGGGSAVLVRRLHRANRLAPGRPTGAPTTWLWSLRRCALLHRRLRAVCQAARSSSDPPASSYRRRRSRQQASSPLNRVARDVVEQALALDSRLVAADRLSGPWKRRAVAGLAVEVGRLEASAVRLRGLAEAWHDYLESAGPVATVDLRDQLDAVEAALGELGAGA
jgi:hypothetical protein